MLAAAGIILVITSVVGVANRLLPFRICPICTGVSGTWLLITLGILAGYLPATSYQLPVAILMGGTVAGIAYQGEKRFEWARSNSVRFKTTVILTGFLLAYYALNLMSWNMFWAEVVVLGLIVYVYFIMPGKIIKGTQDPIKIKKIEEELKNCC